MSFSFEHHPDDFFAIPSIVISKTGCTNPMCTEIHYRLAITFLVWDLAIYL